ncbi:MAG: hypothetical protein ACLR7Z_12320 [Bilophila wadsworthia]
MRIIPVRYDTKEELEERIRKRWRAAFGFRGRGRTRGSPDASAADFLDEPQPVNIRNAVAGHT